MLDYQSTQQKLVPILATCYGLHFSKVSRGQAMASISSLRSYALVFVLAMYDCTMDLMHCALYRYRPQTINADCFVPPLVLIVLP